MHVVAFALAALIGLSLGMLGGGGSILAVPVFVYGFGLDAKTAIAMSLPVVGSASLVGAVGHGLSGNVDLRVAALFGVVAMIGAYAGARAAVFMPGHVQLVLLAIIMIAAAIAMFRSGRRDASNGDARSGHLPAVRRARLALVALGVGIVTGTVGIGGGFLIVPALVLFAGLSMPQAVGTSLLVIAMNAAAAFLGYVGKVTLSWGLLLSVMAVTGAGILVGTRLMRHVPQAALKQAFAGFLVLIAGFLLYRNLPATAPLTSHEPAAVAGTILPRR